MYFLGFQPVIQRMAWNGHSLYPRMGIHQKDKQVRSLKKKEKGKIGEASLFTMY